MRREGGGVDDRDAGEEAERHLLSLTHSSREEMDLGSPTPLSLSVGRSVCAPSWRFTPGKVCEEQRTRQSADDAEEDPSSLAKSRQLMP